MVNCGRCGLLNREELRFCADCGARLAAPPEARRSIPPSPGQTSVITGRPPQRPVAPAFDFAPQLPSVGVRCPGCGKDNETPGRFCTECGHLLVGENEPRPDPSGPEAYPAPAIQPDGSVVCSRCHGTNAPGMLYCQFCGARVTGATPAPAPAIPLTKPQAAREAPPADEPQARLVVIAQDGTPGTEPPISGPYAEIGRTEGSITLTADPYVSPRHLRVSRRNGRFFVRDLESVNGVYVRLRGPELLRHGDLVLVGLEVLRFELVSDAERGLGPATERSTRVFGSPAMTRHARLCQLTVEGVPRDVYYLCRDETVIGRESGDVVFTNDPFMSRKHASLTRDPALGAFTLADLGSSNGTYLAIRGEQEVVNGDHLRVGQHLFRLDVGGAKR
jgi:pSer/pThr/pTyr-binding forkhead associated (FHA) protein